LIDAEGVFGYRAFRFSRGDQTPLSSFDEHLYVNAVDVKQRFFQRMAPDTNTLG